MFAANVLTIWTEALKAAVKNPLYTPDETHFSLKDIPVLTEYPMTEANYPGLWVNYTMQGDLKNVGIGHVEYVLDDEAGGFREVYRWHFGGFVELTIGALSNLERALLFDELTRIIAVARVDENNEGVLRETIERNDLIGMSVIWESLTVSGFGESQGTPWGSDDVLYEATITLTTEGVLDPRTGVLVPLREVRYDISLDDSGASPDLP
jgi:hypothetical protein